MIEILWHMPTGRCPVNFIDCISRGRSSDLIDYYSCGLS
jgi:hypothetical protein